jgi:hypothetical protein
MRYWGVIKRINILNMAITAITFKKLAVLIDILWHAGLVATYEPMGMSDLSAHTMLFIITKQYINICE